MSRRVLFLSSEVFPLIKTGGLADVAGSLPRALMAEGHDIRLCLPAYQGIMEKLTSKPRLLLQTMLEGQSLALWQARLPGSRVTCWFVDCPEFFDRPGNPYHDDSGEDWPDNAHRFAFFCKVAAMIALDQLGLEWQADVVHCNDWQTGLVPVYMNGHRQRPATVFTIHNLAYQGVFSHQAFTELGIPHWYWSYERLEFHGRFSFIKGGLVFADRLTTVSPHYAEEITTPAFGCGLDGLLSHRRDRLSGVLNGIDEKDWNPGTDEHLAKHYNWQKLENKAANKTALLKAFGLKPARNVMLFGLVSRLVNQKGIDLILSVMKELIHKPVQFVVLGSGDKSCEKALKKVSNANPGKVGVRIGYDEGLAHLLEAGADVFLMPSRFEPCGLNQMYSQRYGTLPLVTPVGGLYDTVVDAGGSGKLPVNASGFVMQDISGDSLLQAVDKALSRFKQPETWRKLQRQAMKKDFSWKTSARAYTEIYEQAIADSWQA